MIKQRPGFLMVTTLMVLGIMVFLITYIFNRSLPFITHTTTLTKHDQAKQLALGGIQLGISQLAWAAAPQEGKKKPQPLGKQQPEPPEEKDKRFLEIILPVINRWQTIDLTENNQGIEGNIQIAISCEDGKININEIYDFEHKKFVGEGNPPDKADYKKIMQALCGEIDKQAGGKKLFDALAAFLKKRDYPLNDVTELLTSKEFEIFKHRLFYEPPELEKTQQKQKKQIYLTDIFTVASAEKTVRPWLLSNSMCGLLNLEQVKPDDIKKRKESVTKWLNAFKSTAKWDEDWDKMLAPVYGTKYNAVPKFIKPIFATKFGPNTFSILSYGKVDNVTQRFLAIVEKDTPSQNNDGRAVITIRKLYWL